MGQRLESSEGVLAESLDVVILYEPEGQSQLQRFAHVSQTWRTSIVLSIGSRIESNSTKTTGHTFKLDN